MSFTLPNVLLLIKNSETQAEINQLLSGKPFHLFFQTDPEKALSSISAFRPEIVVVDSAYLLDLNPTLLHRIQVFHPAPYLKITNTQKLPTHHGNFAKEISAASLRINLAKTLTQLTQAHPLPTPEHAHPQRRDIVIGNLRIDRFTKQAWLSEAKLNLTAQEYDLLIYLVINANSVAKPEELLKRVKSLGTENSNNSVDLYIARLRKLLRDDGPAPEKIKTVEGGYLLARDAW